jgi:hypothetical protein
VLPHRSLLTAYRYRARAQQQQLHEVASIQWQLLYLFLTHELADGGTVSVQCQRLRHHFHSFSHRSGLQRDIDANPLVDRKCERVGHGFLESRHLCRHGIASRVE